MEHKKYYVKRKESLESIANELGISSENLRGYHNRFCELNDLLSAKGENLQKVGYILIPYSIEQLKINKEKEVLLKTFALEQKPTETLTYLILQNIDMQVSGDSIVDSETEILWKYKKEQNQNSFYAELFQKEHQVKYIKSIYRALTEYMQKFNKPLEHLNVKLRPSGEIKEILNQKDIEDKWLLLKEELSPEMGDTLEEKQMLEGGDNDFKNSLPLLKNSLLHRLFFMDLYKSYTISDTFYSIAPLKYTSQIFNQEEIFLITKQKIEKNNYSVKIKFFSEADIEKNKHLKAIYNSKLRDFLKQEFNYQFTWSLEYTFDMQQGIMLECHSKIKEQAANNYTHLTEHKISLTENLENI